MSHGSASDCTIFFRRPKAVHQRPGYGTSQWRRHGICHLSMLIEILDNPCPSPYRTLEYMLVRESLKPGGLSGCDVAILDRMIQSFATAKRGCRFGTVQTTKLRCISSFQIPLYVIRRIGDFGKPKPFWDKCDTLLISRRSDIDVIRHHRGIITD